MGDIKQGFDKQLCVDPDAKKSALIGITDALVANRRAWRLLVEAAYPEQF